MSAPVPNSKPPVSSRFWMHLPRPLWIGVVAGVMAVAAVGLRVGIPVYRQHLAKSVMAKKRRRPGAVGSNDRSAAFGGCVIANRNQDKEFELLKTCSRAQRAIPATGIATVFGRSGGPLPFP